MKLCNTDLPPFMCTVKPSQKAILFGPNYKFAIVSLSDACLRCLPMNGYDTSAEHNTHTCHHNPLVESALIITSFGHDNVCLESVLRVDLFDYAILPSRATQCLLAGDVRS